MTTLDHVFAALADPTRRAILDRLAQGEASVGQLAEPFRISLPAISRHLRVLEQAALIVRERDGKHRRCTLRPQALAEAHGYLEHYQKFWTQAFDRPDEYLERDPDQRSKS